MGDSRFDVVGSGPVALALAIAATRLGSMPTLYVGANAKTTEPLSHDAPFEPRVVALSPASKQLLELLGVWQQLPHHRITPVLGMHVWASANEAPLRFDAHRAQVPALAWIVEHRALMLALKATVVNLGAPLEASAFGASRLDGTRGVLIAEGADSALRQHAGLRVTTTAYAHRALVVNVKLGRNVLSQEAWQVFSPANAPRSVIALLPMPGDHACVVWSMDETSFSRLSALPDAELQAEIALAFGGRLSIAAIASERESAPLKLVQPTTIARGRYALVGDAAHALHPMAGQGLNLGFGDVAALHHLWRTHADFTHPLVLAAYARARAGATLQMQTLTDSLWRSFSGEAPLPARARIAAFWAAQHVPGATTFLSRAAFG
jgi:2-polyprenylphenol 6-hydroxylase